MTTIWFSPKRCSHQHGPFTEWMKEGVSTTTLSLSFHFFTAPRRGLNYRRGTIKSLPIFFPCKQSLWETGYPKLWSHFCHISHMHVFINTDNYYLFTNIYHAMRLFWQLAHVPRNPWCSILLQNVKSMLRIHFMSYDKKYVRLLTSNMFSLLNLFLNSQDYCWKFWQHQSSLFIINVTPFFQSSIFILQAFYF